MIKNANTRIGTTNDGTFERTAIIMNENSNSFDLLDQKGNLIARINVLETDKYYNVDIIRNTATTLNSKVIAWNNGNQILNEDLPSESKVIACLLNKK